MISSTSPVGSPTSTNNPPKDLVRGPSESVGHDTRGDVRWAESETGCRRRTGDSMTSLSAAPPTVVERASAVVKREDHERQRDSHGTLASRVDAALIADGEEGTTPGASKTPLQSASPLQEPVIMPPDRDSRGPAISSELTIDGTSREVAAALSDSKSPSKSAEVAQHSIQHKPAAHGRHNQVPSSHANTPSTPATPTPAGVSAQTSPHALHLSGHSDKSTTPPLGQRTPVHRALGAHYAVSHLINAGADRPPQDTAIRTRGFRTPLTCVGEGQESPAGARPSEFTPPTPRLPTDWSGPVVLRPRQEAPEPSQSLKALFRLGLPQVST